MAIYCLITYLHPDRRPVPPPSTRASWLPQPACSRPGHKLRRFSRRGRCSPCGGGITGRDFIDNKQRGVQAAQKDTRLEKYITLVGAPTAEVRGPSTSDTRIWARKYWQLSREMSTPFPVGAAPLDPAN